MGKLGIMGVAANEFLYIALQYCPVNNQKIIDYSDVAQQATYIRLQYP